MAAHVVKRVLMIAAYYPPMRGSSGVQRTLKFTRDLPHEGWQPLVLTMHPRAYLHTGDDELADVPPGAVVRRAFALDTMRHLAIRGRYPGFLAWPDRWVSWACAAVPAGLAMIRRHRPQVIWSTFPIASAHLAALVLQRLSGLPWIADFRDSMTEENYPEHPFVRKMYRRIEAATVRGATRSVFTTPGTIRMYRHRYAELPAERCAVIANGYDEESFRTAASAATRKVGAGRRLDFLHSGLLYPKERDPRCFFEALATLRDAGEVGVDDLCVTLRATGHDAYYREILAQLRLEGLVRLEPLVGHVAALEEMLATDALLVLQATNSNHQIPAKVYEYLRARRPILGLTDPKGDTAQILLASGIDTLAPLDDAGAIAALLRRFIGQVRAGTAPLASDAVIASHSRRARATELASLLDGVIAAPEAQRAPMQMGH